MHQYDRQRRMTESKQSAGAVWLIDAMRLLAAWLVLAGHARILTMVHAGEMPSLSSGQKFFYFLTAQGSSSVMVFFVVSGYLVGGGVLKDLRAGVWSFSKYAVARISRIYTVLIPALLVGGVVDCGGIYFFPIARAYAEPNYGVMLPISISENISWMAMLGNIFAMQDVLVPTFGSNKPLWSLANEVWYYIIFPLFVLPLFRRTCWVSILMVSIGLIVWLMLPPKMAGLFLAWLVGAGAAVLPRLKFLTQGRAWTALVFALMLMLVWLFLITSKKLPAHWWVTAVLAAVMIHLSASANLTIPHWIAEFLRTHAERTFSVYLFHTPIIVLLAAILVGTGDKLQPDGMGVLSVLFVVVLAGLWVQLMWWLFEKNTPKVRAWLRGVIVPSRKISV